jgi:photosystem II stability/assembly factor-like uncharacterized protein
LGALLSCSSSGGETASVPPISPSWESLFRKVGNSHLRTVRFADANQGIVAGEATSFYRTVDGGTTWFQQEHLPTSAGGDVAAMDVHPADGLLHAVGKDEAGMGRVWTSGTSVYWNSGAPPGTSTSPFTSVDSVGSSDAYYLRQDGTVEHWQGAQASTENVGGSGNWYTLDFYQTGGPALVGGTTGIRKGVPGTPMTFSATTLAAFGTSIYYDLQYAPSSNTVAYACGTGGAVVKTTDANAATPTWNSAAGGLPNVTFRSIMFPNNDLIGWVVGDGGNIWATGNGGTSWIQQGAGVTTENLYDIWVMPVSPTQYTAFAVGDYGTVLKMTTDPAGTVFTWTNLTDPTPNLRPILNAVDFIPDGTKGLVVGRDPVAGQAVIWRTLNDGVTWTDVTAGGPAIPLEFYGVSIPPMGTNYTRAFVCGTTGTLWRTMDFTATPVIWEALTSGTTAILRAIHFPTTEQWGYVAGDSATLRRTSNANLLTAGSVTWTAQSDSGPAPTAYYALSSTLAGQNVYASGTGGKVTRGTAFGTIWSDISIAGAGTIRALQAFSGPSALELHAGSTSPNSFHFAVDVGTVPVWVTRTTPPGPANGLTFTGPGTGWGVTGTAAAPDPGRIFRTVDGGATWIASPEHTREPFNAIWMNSAGKGYAVGDRGTIVRTVNGGQ